MEGQPRPRLLQENAGVQQVNKEQRGISIRAKKKENTDRILVAAYEAEHAFSVFEFLLRHRVAGWAHVWKVARCGSAEVGHDCDNEEGQYVPRGRASLLTTMGPSSRSLCLCGVEGTAWVGGAAA